MDNISKQTYASPFRIMAVFGTRPEAIKLAPLIKLLKTDTRFAMIVTITAQHREMLDSVLSLFHIVPDFDLNIMSADQTLTDISSRVVQGLDSIILSVKPDLIIVHGDTTTAMAASLSSFYHRIPVAHVEAGLRTGRMDSPFPEEMNRRVTAVLSDIHFAPTESARKNLIQENIDDRKIFVTGNTVIDALLSVVNEKYSFTDPVMEALFQSDSKILLLTCHRRENLGERMFSIFRALRRILSESRQISLVFPVHMNPRVREIACLVFHDMENVFLVEPMEYLPFVKLMNRAYFIITDSGGIQEEAPSLCKPVLVIRDTTERPEAVISGAVRLIGMEEETVYKEIRNLLHQPDLYLEMSTRINPYGDGQACARIADAIAGHYL